MGQEGEGAMSASDATVLAPARRSSALAPARRTSGRAALEWESLDARAPRAA